MKTAHILAIAAAAVAAFAGGSAFAQATNPGHVDHHASAAAPPPVDGEVRKIDKGQGKVTLKHAPIPHLEMPGMTMVFKVVDPRMLDTLKEGDKVKFAADRVNGAFTVTAIAVVK